MAYALSHGRQNEYTIASVRAKKLSPVQINAKGKTEGNKAKREKTASPGYQEMQGQGRAKEPALPGCGSAAATAEVKKRKTCSNTSAKRLYFIFINAAGALHQKPHEITEFFLVTVFFLQPGQKFEPSFIFLHHLKKGFFSFM